MHHLSRKRRLKYLILLPLITIPVVPVASQDSSSDNDRVLTTVYGNVASQGPEIEGVIVARDQNRIQVRLADGSSEIIYINDDTEIKGTGGFLGIRRSSLDPSSLINGLPVKIKTFQARNRLLADQIKFRDRDLRTAQMIQSGTAQRFADQDIAIDRNTTEIGSNSSAITSNSTAITTNAAAAEALRGRLADIDKYNIVGTTNVYFATGQYSLSTEAEYKLCRAATEAATIDNSLLLVVGYTDSTGSYEVNQRLSERRAGRVVNYLQQQCSWKPWRMLAPSGMATADPQADNTTAIGGAQNRRVSVNILVSKSLESE